jgi:hypothetical protein
MCNRTFGRLLALIALTLSNSIYSQDNSRRVISNRKDRNSGVEVTISAENRLTVAHAMVFITVENKASKPISLTENCENPVFPFSATQQGGSVCAYVHGGQQKYGMGLFISATHTHVIEPGGKQIWKFPLEDFIELSPGILHVNMGISASIDDSPRKGIDLSPEKFDLNIESK